MVLFMVSSNKNKILEEPLLAKEFAAVHAYYLWYYFEQHLTVHKDIFELNMPDSDISNV